MRRRAKNYLNNRDKFDSDSDASSLSGDNHSDLTVSGDESNYSSDSEPEDIVRAQKAAYRERDERKVAAEQELRAINLSGYLTRLPQNAGASGNRYTNPYVHSDFHRLDSRNNPNVI